MTKEISELPLKSVPESTDEMETQISGNGDSRKITLSSLVSLLGSPTPGFYSYSTDINDDATHVVNAFSTNNLRAIVFIVLNWSTAPADTNAIYAINTGSIATIYHDGLTWTNGNASDPDDDNKMNIWINNTPSPRELNIKNRSGGTRTIRFFIFSYSAGA